MAVIARTVSASEIASDPSLRLAARVFCGPTDKEIADQERAVKNLENRLGAAKRKLTQMKKDRDHARRTLGRP